MTLDEAQLDSLAELEADLHKAQEAAEYLHWKRTLAIEEHKKALAAVKNLRNQIKARLIAGEVSDSFNLRDMAPRVHITGPVPDAFMVTPAPTPEKTAIKRHLQEGGDTNWARLVRGKALHKKLQERSMPGDFDWDAARVLLERDLDKKHVRSRKQGGVQLSYIEGWHAIAEANRIFGFGGWSCETLAYAEQSRETVESIGKQPQHRVSYTAHVRITVGGVTRDGLGYGSGFAPLSQGVGGAIEGAIKEAETDATKRALKSFGWQFGLALYDKSRAHVSDAPQAYQDAPKSPSLSDTIANLKYQSVDDARKALEPYRDLSSGMTTVCSIMELIEKKPPADEIQAAMRSNGMGRLMKSLQHSAPEAHDALRAYSLLSFVAAKDAEAEADAEIERKHLEMDNAAKVAA